MSGECAVSVATAFHSGLQRFSHEAMACTWELFILGEAPGYAAQVAKAAFDEVDRLERELSRFIPTSDIARINALRAGQSLRVGSDAFACLEMAKQVHEDTHGAFDVTVGALVRPNAAGQMPPAVGMHLLTLDRTAHAVTVQADGLIVDLGAIGKGYAIDQVIALLRDWGVRTALLHSGQSTVYALGAPPGQPGWRMALRDPLDHSAALAGLCLRDQALSGSGTLLHGEHIIDPRTRSAARGPLGAWAMADSATMSDAISTALMVISPDSLDEFCRNQPMLGTFICVAGAGGRGELRSS
ncbi:MAG TPA: FAD:protein FMN transferase [Phycisphaerae bacterium]